MNQNLIQDIGENFEYVKTIVSNTIEIKKIEAAESVAQILGKLILSVFVILLTGLILVGFCVICVIWLASVLGSTIQAIVILCGVCFITLVLLYLFRKPLLYRPCISFIDSIIDIDNKA